MSNESYITLLHSRFQPYVRSFINQAQAQGWSITITSGYRSWSNQYDLNAINPKNAKPGYSYHNYGMAIDINATKGSTTLVKGSSKEAWIRSGLIGIANRVGLYWGGNFKDYHDPVHFDLSLQFNIEDLRKIARLVSVKAGIYF